MGRATKNIIPKISLVELYRGLRAPFVVGCATSSSARGPGVSVKTDTWKDIAVRELISSAVF